MKNAIYNNEYITNKSQVLDVLKKKKFKLEYLGVQDKMYRYILSINKQEFEYFEGLGHDILDKSNLYDKILNALWCLLQDSDIFTFFKSIDTFMQEYGYIDYIQAKDIYDKCKETKRKLSTLFNISELRVLRDNINF